MFEKKTWADRVSEYPTRRKLVKEDGTSEIVTVERSEGSISVEGDAFSAENMNDMEERIGEAFGALSAADGTNFRFGVNEKGEYGYIVTKDGADTVIPFKKDPIIDVSYADEAAIYIDDDTSGTATTNLTLLKNSTYIVTTFYSFTALKAAHYGVNCTVAEIEATNTSGELTNLKSYNSNDLLFKDDWEKTSWRGYRVDRIVTGDTDCNYTASCTASRDYGKLLYLNTVAVYVGDASVSSNFGSTDDGEGNVTLSGDVSATDDGQGNVSIL